MSKKNYMQAQNEILERMDIVEYISKHMTLKKNGVNYTGLCPFHNEKTGSFIVSKNKGIYKCFGCGTAGNIVKFHMEHDKLDWKEAIEDLAKLNNIELGLPADSNELKLMETHRNMLVVASKFYHARVGKIRDHIHERLITDESIEKYNLGYSDNFASINSNPDNSLVRYLYKQGFTIDEMLSQGLIIFKNSDGYPDEKDPKNYFERFNGRWIFPIYDERDKIVGFSGRILPQNEDSRKYAKYINSPDSDLYNKSTILYGLNIIKDKLLKIKKVHLVEGYTDTIVMNQEGLWSVAACGTAFTDTQAKKLLKYVNDTLLVRDNDAEDINSFNPGLNAAKKDFKTLLTYGMPTKAIVLPPTEDPASFFLKYTRQEFDILEKLNLAQLYVKTSDISDPDKKVTILENIVQELTYIDDPVKKYLWINEVAKSLGIPEQFIARKYTEEINTEIKANNTTDYFSKSFVNSMASVFVAKILFTASKESLPYLRDVPINDIPNDGSIFSPRLMDFYKRLNDEFSMGNYQLSLFGMDTKNMGTEINTWKLLIEDGKQTNLYYKSLDYSMNLPELAHGIYEVTKNESYDLEYLAKFLRSEIFLQKQNVLMSKISEGILSGTDISDLVDQVEKLNHRV